MQRDEDFDTDYDYTLKTQGLTAFQSGTPDAIDFISEGYSSGASIIPKAEFDGCSSKNRNLWITITRTKNSTKSVQSFLSENARSLQGAKFHDLELGFVSI